MRRDALLRMAALLALGGFATLSASAQQSPDQQSSDAVAEAARKARAEKQTAPKPKKVYTDDDFASKKEAPAAPAVAATEGDQASAAQTSKDAAVTDTSANDPKSEAYWRKRFRSVRDKLETSEKELDVLQRELDKDQVQYYSDPQKALMQQYDRKDINSRTAKVDAKKKEIEDLKKQLSDMEDELRKGGGDPGWAR